MSASRSVSASWLFGPATDLLLGCGLLYAGVFLALGWVGSDALSTAFPAGVVVMLAAIPHYGATLLRTYESEADRRRYSIFSLWTTLLLAVLFVAGLRSAMLGSIVLTVYLTWSPWHYTGQNYGITLMMLGRRGVTVHPAAKRLLHLSFVSSYVLTFLAVHGAEPSASYAPVSYQGSVFHLVPLGLPAALTSIAIPLVVVVLLASTLGALIALGRQGRLRDLVPVVLLLATQSLWFSIPVAVRYWQLAGDSMMFQHVYTAYGFIWIAFAHAVQYLWVTTYYARTAGSAPSIPVYLGKTVLAGYAVWTLPALLFAPGVLGELHYESGLALQVAAIVNIHHFILDGAIWKLRDPSVGEVLLRTADGGVGDETSVAAPRSRRVSLQPWIWAAGGLALAVALAAAWEDSIGRERALRSNDLARVRTAARRLEWLGRDGPTVHRQIARVLASRRELRGARLALEHSLAVRSTPDAHIELARLLERQGALPGALQHIDSVLVDSPDRADMLFFRARLLLALERPLEALGPAQRAAELEPDRQPVQLLLKTVIRRLGPSEEIP